MRIAVLCGCLVMVLGGISVAAHMNSHRGSAAGEGAPGAVVRYAYADGARGRPGNFVVQARREAFLGEMTPNETCAAFSGNAGEGSEMWKACMSRLTGRLSNAK
jgi:hypothetical protein